MLREEDCVVVKRARKWAKRRKGKAVEVKGKTGQIKTLGLRQGGDEGAKCESPEENLKGMDYVTDQNGVG